MAAEADPSVVVSPPVATVAVVHEAPLFQDSAARSLHVDGVGTVPEPVSRARRRTSTLRIVAPAGIAVAPVVRPKFCHCWADPFATPLTAYRLLSVPSAWTAVVQAPPATAVVGERVVVTRSSPTQ